MFLKSNNKNTNVRKSHGVTLLFLVWKIETRNKTNKQTNEHTNKHTNKRTHKHKQPNKQTLNETDNQEPLEVIESKPNGLLFIMEEEVRFPNASDATLLDKMHTKHEKTKG